MIKFILPNNEKHFHKFNSDISIKENLNDFCKEKGLVSDIYEVYDPTDDLVLDCNKKLLDYNLNSLHLRRVNSHFSSEQSSQDLVNCTDNSDKLWNEQSIRTYSQNSYNQIQMLDNNVHKKVKKGFMYQLKKYMPKKDKNMSRSYSESLESPVEKEIITLSTDKIYQGSLATEIIQRELQNNQKNRKKKKRNAPPPPVTNFLTFHFEDNSDSKLQSIDIEIPLPPTDSSELGGDINYYPWQSCVESYADECYKEESVYSTISEDPLPLSPGFSVFETPRCPTPKEMSDDGRESPEHTYATIFKDNKIDNDNDKIYLSVSSSESSNEGYQYQTIAKIPDEKIFTIENPELYNNRISQELSISDNITILGAPNISLDSDGSSISSFNNDVVVEKHKESKSPPQGADYILTVSPIKNNGNIKENILLKSKQYPTDSNFKTEEINFPSNVEYKNNNGLLLPSIKISSSPEQNLSKTSNTLHTNKQQNKQINNRNANLDGTDSKEFLKSNPPKLYSKPSVKKNNPEKRGPQTRKLNHNTKNSPVQPLYDDGKMRIEKQGPSLFFYSKPKQ